MNWDFLDIYLATFFEVRNFGNKSAMRLIFFSENVQNLMYISKMQQKIQQKLFAFKIIASELVVVKLSLLRREYLSSAVNV